MVEEDSQAVRIIGRAALGAFVGVLLSPIAVIFLSGVGQGPMFHGAGMQLFLGPAILGAVIGAAVGRRKANVVPKPTPPSMGCLTGIWILDPCPVVDREHQVDRQRGPGGKGRAVDGAGIVIAWWLTKLQRP